LRRGISVLLRRAVVGASYVVVMIDTVIEEIDDIVIVTITTVTIAPYVVVSTLGTATSTT
jgi:hypothetical protein